MPRLGSDIPPLGAIFRFMIFCFIGLVATSVINFFHAVFDMFVLMWPFFKWSVIFLVGIFSAMHLVLGIIRLIKSERRKMEIAKDISMSDN